MAISADYAQGLAQGVAVLYQEAEAELVRQVAGRVARGIDGPDWVTAQLASVRASQATTAAYLGKVQDAADVEVSNALTEGYLRGADAASRDLGAAGQARQAFGGPNRGALTALIDRTKQTLGAQTLTIASQASEMHRQVVQQASVRVLTGTATPRQAATKLLQDFADKGVTGFVDKAGRNWSMQAYAEMATRTQATQALVAGHVNRLQSSGHDLVLASSIPESCEQCRPWQGKVLSLTGAVRTTDVEVAGTLAQAKDAGFLHPGCRHAIGAYFPGLTTVPHPPQDQAATKLREQQRYKERRTRALKGRVDVAERVSGTGSREAVKARADLAGHQRAFKSWREENGRKNLAYRTQVQKPNLNPRPDPATKAAELDKRLDKAFDVKPKPAPKPPTGRPETRKEWMERNQPGVGRVETQAEKLKRIVAEKQAGEAAAKAKSAAAELERAAVEKAHRAEVDARLAAATKERNARIAETKRLNAEAKAANRVHVPGKGWDEQVFRSTQDRQVLQEQAQAFLGRRGRVTGFGQDGAGLGVEETRQVLGRVLYHAARHPEVKVNVAVGRRGVSYGGNGKVPMDAREIMRVETEIVEKLYKNGRPGAGYDRQMTIRVNERYLTPNTGAHKSLAEGQSTSDWHKTPVGKKVHDHHDHTHAASGDLTALETSVTHEWGHVLDLGPQGAAVYHNPVKIQALIDKNGGMAAHSVYGRTNTYEAVAEAFADVEFNGDKASKLSKAIYRDLVKRAKSQPVTEGVAPLSNLAVPLKA